MKAAAILISDRVDLWISKVTQDREVHYIMIKRPTLQEDITILNMYSANNRASNHARQKLIKLQRETEESTISYRLQYPSQKWRQQEENQ